MQSRDRYIIAENIERFEALLVDRGLDDRQAGTVRWLLARAHAELVAFDSPGSATAAVAVAVLAAMCGVTAILA